MSSNGQQPDTIELPRPLVQAILDLLGRLPAGEVYPLLKALDIELGLTQQQPAAAVEHETADR